MRTVFLTLALLLAQQAHTQKAALVLEAALVYRSGDVKPVARVEFFVLDASLATILTDARLVLPESLDLLTRDKGEQMVIGYGKAMLNAPGYDSFRLEAQRALKPHIVGVLQTDFQGKAELANLPAKPVYLVAASRAGRSWIVWNAKTDLKPGQNRILLDQNNAAFYF